MLKGAEIIALCDRNVERLNVIGEEFGIDKRYVDPAQLFENEKLDFVDIATTAPRHRALVELSASHGFATICQKPFATTMRDAEAMVAVCARAKVPLMVHENFRWQSAIQKIGAVLSAGDIGEIFWGRVSFRSAYDLFSGQLYLAKGKRFIVEDLGIHALDIARFLFGDVNSVRGQII